VAAEQDERGAAEAGAAGSRYARPPHAADDTRASTRDGPPSARTSGGPHVARLLDDAVLDPLLRGSRGDAAETEPGSSFVKRVTVNTGTVPVLPVA